MSVYYKTQQIIARLVKLADTQDLGSCIARCAGSSPASRTKIKKALFPIWGDDGAVAKPWKGEQQPLSIV